MCDENSVGAWLGQRGEQRTKRFGTAIVLVWRHDEAAFGEIRRLFDILKTGEHGGLVAAVIFAGVDLADRDADLTQRIPELLCKHFALVVQIPLGGDVVEIERVSVRFIGESGAVTKKNDKATGPQRLRDLLIARRGG